MTANKSAAFSSPLHAAAAAAVLPESIKSSIKCCTDTAKVMGRYLLTIHFTLRAARYQLMIAVIMS